MEYGRRKRGRAEEPKIIETSKKITLKSNLKTSLEHFVDTEIKKKFNKKDFSSSFKKLKTEYTFVLVIKDDKICQDIVNTIRKSESIKSKEVEAFLDGVPIEEEKSSFLEETQLKIPEEKTLKFVENKREILIKNIPNKLSDDKLYEIFFIFGDISSIEYVREQSLAFLKFKYCVSAQKAFTKLNSEKKMTVNLNVEFSERENVEGDEIEEKSGRVIFLKFEDAEKVPQKEEIKKHLSKFGLITKIFRKKESRSFYVEFSSSNSAVELFNSLKEQSTTIKYLKDAGYAFNKGTENSEGFSNIQIKSENFETEKGIRQSNEVNAQSLAIDPNKHWQVYFDSNYNMNFYYNPFFNKSEWTLPEGAELTPYQNTEAVVYNTESKEDSEAHHLPEQNYYDEDAWEEDELAEKLAWDRMQAERLSEWMKRPARRQVADTRKDTAYVEGNYDYNIWYDKYLSDRKEEKEKIPALHRCNPALDTGFTKADLQEKEGGAFFCLYFAKGCCSEGVDCRYYHRVPTIEDAEKIENLRDVFGRSRFANHRNDMGGVGSFTKECRSIFVNELKTLQMANPVREMVKIIYDNFSSWGEIEDVNYIPAKATCFIRYSHRCSAEFAKEAMIGQALVGEEILTVRWAYDDPNPMNKKFKERENENRFLSSVNRKSQGKNYGYSSGYGETPQVLNVSDQSSTNYNKLTSTLQMIDQMNQENDYI